MSQMLRLLALVLAGTHPVVEEHLVVPAHLQAATQRLDEIPVDDVVVVTASRREERLMNAPATMTVVTDDVIGAIPGRSFAELLRLVPGLNVVQTSARDINVTARAATGTLSDSMLVLLDGRSVYQDFFGAVLWDFLPVDSSEIKQIEVIRGPASAIWGANAMTGVVNVITKTPRELQGTSAAIRYGQFDRSPAGGPYDGGGVFSVSATHAQATSDRFAYKVSAGILTQESFARPTGTIAGGEVAYPSFLNRGTTQPRVDARADYDMADKRQKIILAGGISATEGILHSGLGPLDAQRGSTFKYGRVTYTRGKLKLQAFVNALDGEARAVLLENELGGPLDFSFENQAYDAEFSNLHLLRGRHVLSYGGNYRHNNFDLSFAPRGVNRDEGGAYVQDEIVFSNRYRWIVGARIDRFDVLRKAVISPRTAFLVKPARNQTIRLSVNRAFRAPSFVNSYLETRFLTEVDRGAAGRFQVPAVAVGNDRLKEEALTAYEVGYIGAFRRTTVSGAGYVNRTKNMIQFTDPVPAQFTYINFDRITDRGVEVSADVRVTNAVSTFVNYSWQAQPTFSRLLISEINIPPRHRFNAGVNVARGRYFGSLFGSFVDSAFWQDVLPDHKGRTDAYTLVDGAFGVHSPDRMMTVAIRGRNLLNTAVPQHIFGDVIGRSIIGDVRVQF
jgi:outer membrane receptor protein involved in Fe transport